MSAELERAKLRLSHAERDRAVDHLEKCTADGRLSLDEFAERVEAVYGAKTFGELAPLVADLPPLETDPAAAPNSVMRVEPTSAAVRRGGRWLVPRRLVICAHASSVRLDFTEAVIGHREVDVELELRSSSLLLILPPGAIADDRIDVRAASSLNRATAAATQTGLLFRVHGSATTSSVRIRHRRRFLWWSY
jgi:hypothetical protein